MVRAPLGAEQTLELALRMRAFDVWVHEQDLRWALGKPGNLDSPGAYVARDILLHTLPRVVAKDAGAPPNSAVVFDIHGPVEFLRTVRVDADGHGTVDGAPRSARSPRSRWTGRRSYGSPAAGCAHTPSRTG